MNQHLLQQLADVYRRIKVRGATWDMAQGLGWYSNYSGDPGKRFLGRFDESLQAKIKALADIKPTSIDVDTALRKVYAERS